MNENQLQIVNYSQAVLLRKFGFDWECNRYYYGYPQTKLNPKGLPNLGYCEKRNSNITKGNYSAPTVALALKWFRDVKGIGCSVTQVISIGKKSTYYSYSYNLTYGCQFSIDRFDTYESAENALLDELLNLLEQEKS